MCDYGSMTCCNPNKMTVQHPVWGDVGICDDCLPDFEDYIDEFEHNELYGDEDITDRKFRRDYC